MALGSLGESEQGRGPEPAQFFAATEDDEVPPSSAHGDVDEVPFTLKPSHRAWVGVHGQDRGEQDGLAFPALEGEDRVALSPLEAEAVRRRTD